MGVEVQVSNVGTADGYLPFVDFFLPAAADGSGAAWLAFTSLSLYGQVDSSALSFSKEFTFTSRLVNATTTNDTTAVIEYEAQCVDHPFANNASGLPLQVCGYTGDFWLSVLLPFDVLSPGSLAPLAQLNLRFQPSIELGAFAPIYCRAGFYEGADPTTMYPSILSDTSSFAANWTSGCSSGIVASLIKVRLVCLTVFKCAYFKTMFRAQKALVHRKQ